MWEETKQIIKTDYPNLDDTSIEFYCLALEQYSANTKCASDLDILDSLYQEGIVSKQSIVKYKDEKLADKITANILDKKAEHGFLENLKSALIAAGTGAAATGILYGTAKGITKLHNNLNRQKQLKQIYKFHPTLRDADTQIVNQTLDDIQRLNPSMAKSPLISGTAIKNVVLEQSFSPEQAKLITDIDYPRKVVDNMLTVGSSAINSKKDRTEEPAKWNFGKYLKFDKSKNSESNKNSKPIINVYTSKKRNHNRAGTSKAGQTKTSSDFVSSLNLFRK